MREMCEIEVDYVKVKFSLSQYEATASAIHNALSFNKKPLTI